MHRLIDWCAFLGAWLLFAGPVYQAETELDAEAREASELRPTLASVPREGEPSKWWWLAPPVAYVRQRRWLASYRKALRAALTPEQTAQMVRFTEKALGWQLVAGGAGLIAVDETWLLVHGYGWPAVVFWVLLAAMVIGTVGFVAARAQRRYDLLELERSGRGRRRRGSAA